ncbi:amino acid ABC transporter permease [Telmatospirillum siberiense]|uniref:Amino acid ABC transporter n=1 Tax=Telmatospirillum siberiense TaxID=382514 RepID=A0A2N3Q1K3_9PROT|nr:amino acid ABC transporter permease [Telmatospirillum siberiense]PKU26538.1 amino acid ABC transporter [Telmatospirillum siberiense]
MPDAILSQLIGAAKQAGFNYAFINDGYESGIWAEGLLTTLEIAGLTIPISLLVGVLLSAAITSRRNWLALPARSFIELTRNTPTLIQLYCAFLVLNMLISNALQGAEHNPLTPFAWVVGVLALHIGAFHAEAFRAGIEAVPGVTTEAALSLGFSQRAIFWRITLPLAFRFSLPSLVNNLVNLLKLTTLGSAIAVGEVTYASIMIWTQHDNVLELMILLLLFFSALAYGLARAGHWLENRLRIPGYDVG